MLEQLKKFGRTLRRDWIDDKFTPFYDPPKLKGKTLPLWQGKKAFTQKHFYAGLMALYALTCGMLLLVSPGAALLTIAIFGKYLGGGLLLSAGATVADLCIKTMKQTTALLSRTPGVPTITLRGKGNDVAKIQNTQHLIEVLTGRYIQKDQIPAAVAKKIQQYINDSASAAARVAVSETGAGLDKVAYMRCYFNSAGRRQVKEIGFTPAALAIRKAQDESKRAAVEAIGDSFGEGTSRDITVKSLTLKKRPRASLFTC